MPFKSEAQRRYLWANEPEIARDWTDTYGSRIQKNTGGITRLGYQFGGGADAGGVNSPGGGTFGGGSNTGAGDDHSYKRENRIQQQYTPVTHTTAPGSLSDIREKQDHFNQTWSGQPNFLGFGGGYRNLKTPNNARSGYQSRLNPMGVMSLLGGFMKKPFTLAATGFNSLRGTLGTGINAVRNKFGPAWNDWTDADNLAEFLRRRRTGETITNPAVRGEYGLPAINIDEEDQRLLQFTKEEEEEEVDLPHYRPSIDYPFDWWNKNMQIWGDTTFPPHKNPHIEKTADWDSEEDVITGTNYPGEDIRTETILDRAKKLNTQIIDGDPESVLEKAKAINDRIKEKQREQEATEGAYYP